MTKKLFHFFICFGSLGFACQASALILDWNLGGPATSSGGNINTMAFVSSGHTLTAKGYCSSQTDGSGVLSGAHLQISAGGLGVSSGGDNTVCGQDSNPAIDTEGRDNFVLFEFDTFMFAKDFQISWSNTDADIQVWFGPPSGGAGLDLTGACVSGCGTTLATLGFSPLSRFNNVPTDTPQAINATTQSRYVVVSGALTALGGSIDGNSDYFRMGKIRAAPIPSTFTLLALGLMGITLSSRAKRYMGSPYPRP
ncbi:MAG: hypothetical protein H0U63_04335 [Burkholderiales bacterium]|nr:hypothetical protein [Burkholderiales bacterium]